MVKKSKSTRNRPKQEEVDKHLQQHMIILLENREQFTNGNAFALATVNNDDCGTVSMFGNRELLFETVAHLADKITISELILLQRLVSRKLEIRLEDDDDLLNTDEE